MMARNKPKTPTPLAVGVDIGGGKIALGLVDEAGQVTGFYEYPTEAQRGPDAIIDDLSDRIRRLMGKADRRVDLLGIGVCGQVDTRAGIVRRSPNLPGWKDTPLGDRLASTLGLPIAIANDVNVIAIGQWRYGGSPEVEDLVVVFVGTGVGGGIIAGGRLLLGHRDHAAEIGHSTIVADGRRCSCGNLGCLEAYVGGWAIAERAHEAAGENPALGRRLIELVDGNHDRIRSETVAEANREGDELARRIVRETGHYFGAGMVGVINSFNPSRLVLGGGVLDGIPELLDMVEAHVRKYALHACTEELEIVRASLGPEAGVIGAATLARERVPTDVASSGAAV